MRSSFHQGPLIDLSICSAMDSTMSGQPSAMFSQSTRSYKRSPGKQLLTPPVPHRAPRFYQSTIRSDLQPTAAAVSSGVSKTLAGSKTKSTAQRRKMPSFESLSHSLMGSLRVRKRRSATKKSEKLADLNASNYCTGGYFDDINQSFACSSHSQNVRYPPKWNNLDKTSTSLRCSKADDPDLSRGSNTRNLDLTQSDNELYDTLQPQDSYHQCGNSARMLRRTSKTSSDSAGTKTQIERDMKKSQTRKRHISLEEDKQDPSSHNYLPTVKSLLRSNKKRVRSDKLLSVSALGPRPDPEGQSRSPSTSPVSKSMTGLSPVLRAINHLQMNSGDVADTVHLNAMNSREAESVCDTPLSVTLNESSFLSEETSRENLSFLESTKRSLQLYRKRTNSKSHLEPSKKLNITVGGRPCSITLHKNVHGKNESHGAERHYWRQQRLNQTFTQGLSLAVGEDPSTVNNVKLLAACSVNNIACQTNGSAQNQSKTGRVASWAVNFQNLLSDPVGIEIFTEFLCKEFSEENIIFWKACEQYRQLKDEQQRKLQAKDIYSRHLSSRASDPVNVDSAARSHTEQFLDSPTTIMFDMAQHQIFQLMRQDSYSRFLKSDVYKVYVMDEMAGKPLECSSTAAATGVDSQGDNAMQDKKKNKGKENEDKRRRSILPWRNGRKSLKGSSDGDSKKTSKKGKEEKEKESKDLPSQNGQQQNGSTGTSTGLNVSITSAGSINNVDHNTNASGTSANAGNMKKAPGPGIDLSTMRKEVFHPKDSQGVSESQSQYKFCRIVMPDGSTTVVCTKPGQSTRYVLGKLCEKRSISLASVDVFLLGSDRLLDLNEDISNLGSKEIVIERRVMFRLDMPSGKSIGVKAKPNRSIRDVFRPILHKYGYNLDNIAVRLVTSQEFLDLDVAVSELDKQRAVVVHINSDVADWVRQGGIPGPIVATVGADPPPQTRSLEEITNKIFEDLMRGKSQLAHGFDELGVLEIDKAKAHKNEEGRSLGLLGLLKKESWAAKDNHKNSKTKGKVTFALPRNESKKKENVKEGERLFELLSSAQSMRIEEQRGVHISPGELPSFLCEKRDNDQIQVKEDDSGKQMFDDIGEISRAGKVWRRADSLPSNMQTPRQSMSTPSGMKYGAKTMAVTPLLSHSDKSFSQDGVMPSPDQGEAYFRMSPIIVDAHSKIASKFPDDTFLQRGKKFYPEVESADSYHHSHSNGSHAFQPLLHSPQEQRRSKAPVASPEKFSPRKKKQRSSPENIPPHDNFDLNQTFGQHGKHTLPSRGNHMSRTMRSPAFDSPSQGYLSHTVSHSSSSSSPHTPIPSPHSSSSPHTVSQSMRHSPQPKQSENVPQPHQSIANVRNRLSDGQLLHKLQQASRDRFLSHYDQNKERSFASSNSHEFSPAFQHPKNSFSSSNTAHKHDSVALAQRALLSPRFDQTRQDKAWAHQPSTSTDMTQRALLSPRFDQNHQGMDPMQYQDRQRSPSVSYGLGTVLSPRYSASIPQREAYRSASWHPHGHLSPTRPLVTQFGITAGRNGEQMEETVTFV